MNNNILFKSIIGHEGIVNDKGVFLFSQNNDIIISNVEEFEYIDNFKIEVSINKKYKHGGFIIRPYCKGHLFWGVYLTNSISNGYEIFIVNNLERDNCEWTFYKGEGESVKFKDINNNKIDIYIESNDNFIDVYIYNRKYISFSKNKLLFLKDLEKTTSLGLDACHCPFILENLYAKYNNCNFHFNKFFISDPYLIGYKIDILLNFANPKKQYIRDLASIKESGFIISSSDYGIFDKKEKFVKIKDIDSWGFCAIKKPVCLILEDYIDVDIIKKIFNSYYYDNEIISVYNYYYMEEKSSLNIERRINGKMTLRSSSFFIDESKNRVLKKLRSEYYVY